MNVKKIRESFPIFKNRPKMIYFDNAATTQKPDSVIQAIIKFYQMDNFNVHRSVYSPAAKTTQEYENVRNLVAKFIGSQHPHCIVFTKGTTDSINLIASGYFAKEIHPGDNIVVSIMEHHSNLLPWLRLAKEKQAHLRYLPLNQGDRLDLTMAKQLIDDRTKLVALTGVSNVLGVSNPVKEIAKIAHSHRAKFLLDAAQMAPEMPINVQTIKPDFLALSGHKMLGPTGVGVLYINSKIIREIQPHQLGGEMIQNVTKKNFTYNTIPLRFEAGTPNIAGVIGLGAAIKFLNQIGMSVIQKRCQRLGQFLADQLRSIPEVIVYGPHDRDSGIVAFNIRGVHPHDVATALDLKQMYVRAGNHCAQPLVNDVLKASASLRASLYFYNTKAECVKFVQEIRKDVQFFHGTQRSISKYHC